MTPKQARHNRRSWRQTRHRAGNMVSPPHGKSATDTGSATGFDCYYLHAEIPRLIHFVKCNSRQTPTLFRVWRDARITFQSGGAGRSCRSLRPRDPRGSNSAYRARWPGRTLSARFAFLSRWSRRSWLSFEASTKR